MRTRTLIAAMLGFAQPHFVIDPAAPAVDQTIAPADTNAAAAPAGDAGESSGDAPAVASVPESDTSSFAAPVSLSGDTAAAGAQQGDTASGESMGAAADASTAGAAPSDPSSTDTMTSSMLSPTDEPTALADTDFAAPRTDDPTPAVSIDVEDHAEARERFAGLMARLHNAEEDFVHALREELQEIGTLLHLHSVASGKADATGDYSSSDLSS